MTAIFRGQAAYLEQGQNQIECCKNGDFVTITTEGKILGHSQSSGDEMDKTDR